MQKCGKALTIIEHFQMASVWEERFKEEAEKTIPLQEVKQKLEMIFLFWYNFHLFVGVLSLEGGHGAAAQEENGVDRHQDGQDSLQVQGSLQGGHQLDNRKRQIIDFFRKTTKSWQSGLFTRLQVFTRG